jgi:hypothetical protein
MLYYFLFLITPLLLLTLTPHVTFDFDNHLLDISQFGIVTDR